MFLVGAREMRQMVKSDKFKKKIKLKIIGSDLVKAR